MSIGSGIASIGIAAATAFGVYYTKEPACLWALLIISFLK